MGWYQRRVHGESKTKFLIHLQTMKAIIFALLVTYICAQAPVPTRIPKMSADELCWTSVCKDRWFSYNGKSRRLQSLQSVVNNMPTITDANCNDRCYDRCMCDMDVPATRNLQAIQVPKGKTCSDKCGGAGKNRRLQSMVTSKVPVCKDTCFNDCYEDALGKARVPTSCRRLQAIVKTNEQVATETCKTKCQSKAGRRLQAKVWNPTTPAPSALARECVSVCVCRK